MKAIQIQWMPGVATAALCLFAMTGCGPTEKQLAARAEATRIDCLDKICYGDVAPKIDNTKEAILKLNGQWYAGPKEYFASGEGAAFYWPSKTPFTGKPNGQPWPEQRQPFYDVAIEIFFTGRQRWTNPNVQEPWEGTTWAKRAGRIESEGYRTEQTKLSNQLELVRFIQPNGKPYGTNFYIATQEQRIRGVEPPVLSCDVSIPPHLLDSCTAGEYWQSDVYADFRLRARHATDWPAIHQEIIRVLNLAKKVQP